MNSSLNLDLQFVAKHLEIFSKDTVLLLLESNASRLGKIGWASDRVETVLGYK
jgi:hypothetical protein